MRILLLLACGGEAPIAPAPVAPVDPPEPEVVARLAVPEPQAPALVRRWTEPSPPVPAQPGGVWRVHHGVSEPIGATTGPAPQEGSWGQEVQVTDAAGQLAWRAVDRWAMQPGTEPIPDHWLRIEAVGARPAPPLRLIHEGDVAQLAALARDGGPLIETTARVAGA